MYPENSSLRVHPRPREWLPFPRELLPVRWASFQLSRAAQPSVAPSLEKRHVHRSAHGEPAAGTCIAHLPRINSAQETWMKACVPGPRFRLGPETRVTLTPSPCPSCTVCDNPLQTVTDRGRAIPQGHVASGDVRGPPGSGLQHPQGAVQQSGAPVPHPPPGPPCTRGGAPAPRA